MTTFKQLKYSIAADEDADLHPAVLLSIDEDGDVWFEDGSHILMVSYLQAQALHQTLGQALWAFDRQFLAVVPKPKLKVHENAE